MPQQPGWGQQPGGMPPQQPGWGQQPGGMPPQQPGWGQQPGGMPPQQPGWGQQPAWAPPAPKSQSSSRPFLVILLIVLLIGLGGLVYWQFGDQLLAFVKSATGGTGSTADTTKPVISGAKADVSVGGVVITWKTDELASSQVEYGKTDTYGSFAPAQPQDDPTTGQSLGVIDHSITLSSASLEKGATYHYRVKSKDKAGNEAVSGDGTFTTLTAQE